MLLLWFIAAAVIILVAQSATFGRYALRRITYQRHFETKACYQGERILLIEQMTNAKWLPVPWLRVESQLSSRLLFNRADNFLISSGELSQNHKSFFALAAYTKVTRKHTVLCARRGWYKLQSVTLTGGDLLAIRSVTKKIALDEQLLVFPKPAQVPIHEIPFSSWQGERSVPRWTISDPFIVAGVRDYQAGDTFKQMNWKATAKTGRMQVHQYDYTADRRLMIYLNVDDVEGMWRSVTDEALVEKGISWAAGAAEAVIRQGMEAGFAANMPVADLRESIRIEPRSGQEQLLRIFEAMAKLTIERTELFHQLLEREAQGSLRSCDVLIISSYWNDKLELQANALRFNGNAVAVWELTADEKEARREEAGA